MELEELEANFADLEPDVEVSDAACVEVGGNCDSGTDAKSRRVGLGVPRLMADPSKVRLLEVEVFETAAGTTATPQLKAPTSAKCSRQANRPL